jgi:hypothetical protein
MPAGWSKRQLLFFPGLVLLLCAPAGFSSGGCVIYAAPGWEVQIELLARAVKGLGVASWAGDGAAEALRGQLTLGCWALLLASLAVLTCSRRPDWRLGATVLGAGSLASLAGLGFLAPELSPVLAAAFAAPPVLLAGLALGLASSSRTRQAAAVLLGTSRLLHALALLSLLAVGWLFMLGLPLTLALCGLGLSRAGRRLDAASSTQKARFVLPPASASAPTSAPPGSPIG